MSLDMAPKSPSFISVCIPLHFLKIAYEDSEETISWGIVKLNYANEYIQFMLLIKTAGYKC